MLVSENNIFKPDMMMVNVVEMDGTTWVAEVQRNTTVEKMKLLALTHATSHHHLDRCTMVQNNQIQTEVLGHSLVRSLVRSHRSLARLLRTARFARALRCAHSFARSLTSLTPLLVGK